MLNFSLIAKYWSSLSYDGIISGFILNNILKTASLVVQIVKNLPATQETWVWSLGQEDPPEKIMATHFSILTWRIPWTEEPGRLQSGCSPWTCKESDTTELLIHIHMSQETHCTLKYFRSKKYFIHLTYKTSQLSLLLLLSHFSRVRLCVIP